VATDQIVQAVAATEKGQPSTPVSIKLGSGREVGLVVPIDMSMAEALDLVGFVAQGLGAELARRREKPKATLFVATGPIPRA
jgi:hypothetical protein